MGTLNVQEFAHMMRANKVTSPEEIMDFLLKIDTDGSRTVDFDEWSTYMAPIIATMSDKKFMKCVKNMVNRSDFKRTGDRRKMRKKHSKKHKKHKKDKKASE